MRVESRPEGTGPGLHCQCCRSRSCVARTRCEGPFRGVSRGDDMRGALNLAALLLA